MEAARRDLPLEAVLLLPQADAEWGERLVALVRGGRQAHPSALIGDLTRIVQDWPPAQRPCRWELCPSLEPSSCGKWRRGHWQEWLASHQAD